MKSSTWQWAKLMGISAFSALLLSIGAGPAAAIPPKPCLTCEPGEPPGGTPPPPTTPPPSYACLYDEGTMTSVPPNGLGSTLLVKRASEKTTYAGFCPFVCPNASYKWQGPGYCDCYNDTIPQLRPAGVGGWEIHDTRYAIWSEPPVANTTTLLIVLAGQNGLSGSSGGGPGNVTGQPNHWDAACNGWNCGFQSFDPASFVGRLLAAPGLNINTANTFAVSFLDHKYDYGSAYEYQIRQGLYNWLRTKVSPTTLKQIIIAGHSRGGCLALGLAKEFRARSAYNPVRILGVTVDGTCKDDGEMGTLSGGTQNIDNPRPDVPSDWFAWNSTFSTTDNRSVCVQNTVGGQPQILGVHSFFLANTAVWHNSFMNIPHIMAGSCVSDQIGSLSGGVCFPGGNFNVRTDVMDRALRFVERNRVP